MSNKLVSVVIPVYNVQKYLSECVYSAISQLYTNIEIILIDDGSTDDSGKVCEELACVDDRIRVFHKENGGVSSARNFGMNAAKGDYVCFVDSDDYINEMYVKDLVMGLTEGSDLVISRIDFPNAPKRKLEKSTVDNEKIPLEISRQKLLSLSGPVCKLFKLDIVKSKGVYFPEDICMGEDGIFFTRYLNCIHKMNVIDVCNYFYRQTEGSLSSKFYPFIAEWNCYMIWKSEVLKLFSKNKDVFFDPLKETWKNRIGTHFLRSILSISRQKPCLSVMNQVTLLRSIPSNDITEFKQYFIPKTRNQRITKFLIVHKLFVLFALVMKFDK